MRNVFGAGANMGNVFGAGINLRCNYCREKINMAELYFHCGQQECDWDCCK
jgi:hypothetical protein